MGNGEGEQGLGVVGLVPSLTMRLCAVHGGGAAGIRLVNDDLLNQRCGLRRRGYSPRVVCCYYWRGCWLLVFASVVCGGDLMAADPLKEILGQLRYVSALEECGSGARGLWKNRAINKLIPLRRANVTVICVNVGSIGESCMVIVGMIGNSNVSVGSKCLMMMYCE